VIEGEGPFESAEEFAGASELGAAGDEGQNRGGLGHGESLGSRGPIVSPRSMKLIQLPSSGAMDGRSCD
jgi:hypothetical protein